MERNRESPTSDSQDRGKVRNVFNVNLTLKSDEKANKIPGKVFEKQKQGEKKKNIFSVFKK